MTKKQRNILVTSIASVLIALYLFGAGFIYIHYNLSTYSVYYAKHLPRAKGTNPEMALFVDNFRLATAPELKGFRYDIDGYNMIFKDENIVLENPPSRDGTEYQLSLLQDRDGEAYPTYSFSKNGSFVYYSYYKSDSKKFIYDKSEKRRKEAIEGVTDILNPILPKLERKPQINLQWLFNQKYQKRFSE